jgi:hypothetical protein
MVLPNDVPNCGGTQKAMTHRKPLAFEQTSRNYDAKMQALGSYMSLQIASEYSLAFGRTVAWLTPSPRNRHNRLTSAYSQA